MHGDYSKRKSFVIYDFTNKLTLNDAIKLNKLSTTKLNDINKKVKEIITKIEFTKIPIRNYRVKDHYFIDLKTKEIFFFDPLVLTDNFHELYNIAKQKLNLN